VANVDMEAGQPSRTSQSSRRSTLSKFLLRPERTGRLELQLLISLLLAASAILYYGVTALLALGIALGAGLALQILTTFGYRRLGLRPVGRYQPGIDGAVVSALLLVAFCPPNLPPVYIAVLAAVAALVEGRIRHMRTTIALNGVIVAWGLAWLSHWRLGLGYVSPFDQRALDEPLQLWTRFQVNVDAVRLYIGNVPGPFGVTSLGLVSLCLLLLGYARRLSWSFLVLFFVPVAISTLMAQHPLDIFVISGPAAAFAGILGADPERLPAAGWSGLSGLLAGSLAASLLRAGIGVEAYGAGVLGSALIISLLQLLNLAGSSARERTPLRLDPATMVRLVALVLFAPIGLLLVWLDRDLPQPQKRSLLALGAIIYIAVGALSMFWLLELRWPG
jgi:hypothetical protein